MINARRMNVDPMFEKLTNMQLFMLVVIFERGAERSMTVYRRHDADRMKHLDMADESFALAIGCSLGLSSRLYEPGQYELTMIGMPTRDWWRDEISG
jgi:hypothetical protein